jgi:hypothetical protein
MGRRRARMIIPSGHEFSRARLCNANRQCNCLDEAQTGSELRKAHHLLWEPQCAAVKTIVVVVPRAATGNLQTRLPVLDWV